ncbi:hypothetical protein [Streptomyces sp. NPDC088258]|uniref:hypothetical protein n=1 Tax=Streptomyces sp. NPDC088258 TaxID=3365849 RepID=UPI00381AAC8F
MRTRTAAAAALVLAVTLTGCGGGDSSDDAKPSVATKTSTPAAKESPTEAAVDCTDGDLSQAEWMEQCDGSGTGWDGGPSTGLAFGKSYEWPDGLEVTVVEAMPLPGADQGETWFRVKLKLTNDGTASVDLGDLSTIVDGATNGGTAASLITDDDGEPLEGRLAPGVTVVKTDDNSLESKYGKKIVVKVQRPDMDFPEFVGAIG